MSLTNKEASDIYIKNQGIVHDVCKQVCKTLGVDTANVVKNSLCWKVKKTWKELHRLKKLKNSSKYEDFSKQLFKLPNSKNGCNPPPPPVENISPLSIHDLHKENLRLQRENIVLRQRLKTVNVKNLNQTIKRKEKRIKQLLQKIKKSQKTENDKKYCKSHKSVQCNFLEVDIQQLQKELEVLKDESVEKNESDEYVHIKKKIDFRENCKGKPFNYKLRNLYYFFISKNIGVEHISPVVKSVLNLFDISVDILPSKSTVSNMSNEMGVLSRIQTNEELLNCTNVTMHRDATTKKGKHFYCVQFSTGDKVLIAGVRELCDGKGETCEWNA